MYRHARLSVLSCHSSRGDCLLARASEPLRKVMVVMLKNCMVAGGMQKVVKGSVACNGGLGDRGSE